MRKTVKISKLVQGEVVGYNEILEGNSQR